MPGPEIRIGTLNIASGRGVAGPSTDAAGLTAALTGLDVDVLAVQEIDVAQPRSHGVDQPAVLGAALGAVDGRFAPTVDGTPDPFRSWSPAGTTLYPLDAPPVGPHYGIALLSRLPVRAWHALGLGAGRAKLPIKAPDPRTGVPQWWWFPDEPRIAVAAELDGLTVVGTHLSFAPHTALRQLGRVRRWARSLPRPRARSSRTSCRRVCARRSPPCRRPAARSSSSTTCTRCLSKRRPRCSACRSARSSRASRTGSGPCAGG